jgi:hypothetical protein
MKTRLYSPDSAPGLSRADQENFKSVRRSPFLYTAALRYHRETLRVQREAEATGARINFQQTMSSEK